MTKKSGLHNIDKTGNASLAAAYNDDDQQAAETGTSLAKVYYDTDDAQKFYSAIWGEETLHIGRYDMLTDSEKETLSHQTTCIIARAEDYHEQEFVRLIQEKFDDNAHATTKLCVLDMGCGYAGLLRRLVRAGIVKTAVGCDISHKMCEQARRLNQQQGLADKITILEESYLHVASCPSESKDLCISMDALLHVGPSGQAQAVKEAFRILRKGGWMIFSDIMQQEIVDLDEMQPIYNRIHLSKMGTVSSYQHAMEEAGFTNFTFLPNSSTNVSTHYGTVYEVLEEKGDELGISTEYQETMKAGLATWRDLGEKNIVWGFIVAQKK